ncbi:conserved hypothetical protein [Histoplasma capsulatum G186AR]|uniref:Wax synthase domain-containing protein n=2 Tax=Ajellomyces capsulatus TaxID=5037 RepID=C0NKR0_AJECG|nr:uncharacterized protein HCBG_03740 [Histoplasma capsulatum G186AR]EEH08451.1 conserved hypothetical protein [Histoplasma capsulatum G186AR]KAG5299233.1 hypothetical protein I7I52_09477 [Histoplasma capsulatum]QSS68147.1 hypothetical protein I7I50_07451 [Histoplasma capsulatum G186AR]
MAKPLVDWFVPTPEGQRAFKQVGINLFLCIASLLVPGLLLYSSLYALAKRKTRSFEILSLLASIGFIASSCLMVLECNMIRSLQLFAVAIGVMKALDLFARRHNPPQYAHDPMPSHGLLALLYLTELRYESFTPNTTRLGPAPAPSLSKGKSENSYRNGRGSPKSKQWKPHFTEQGNLVLHAILFAILQTFFPQSNPTVVALEVLLAIYVLWESLQLLLRYRTSPPLFGPLYTATSLSTFWSETWHSAFASPCRSLAYEPIRYTLPERYGVPVSIARALGVVASFGLMGFFHVYGLKPLLPFDALARIYAFFILNGVGAVIEDAIWGRETHWGKTILAWVFELAIASWTVEGLSVPRGLKNIQWTTICDVGEV